MKSCSVVADSLLERRSDLEVKIATTDREIYLAQKLRYKVFYEEHGAGENAQATEQKRDFDEMDDVCDHLIVLDGEEVVGSYRLITRKAAKRLGRFYTSSEYDIGCLEKYSGNVLELGRSCVARNHRPREVFRMMWQGIARYVEEHEIGLMFGCASFHGTDPSKIEHGLAYLHHKHLAPEEWRPSAITDARVEMDIMPFDKINKELVLQQIPSLIRGYMHLGAYVGDGAFLDMPFNTIDVCIVLFTENLSKSYLQRFLISI